MLLQSWTPVKLGGGAAVGCSWTVSANSQTQLVVTTASKVAVRHLTGPQTEAASWTNRPGRATQLRSAAVQSPGGSRRLWAVQGERSTLHSWVEGDAERAHALETTPPAQVQALHPLPATQAEEDVVAAVLLDGSVLVYGLQADGAGLELLAERRHPATGVSVLWSGLLRIGSRSYVVTLESGSAEQALRVFLVAAGRVSAITKHAIAPTAGGQGTEVSACQIHPSSCALSVAWADGELQVYQFPAGTARWVEASPRLASSTVLSSSSVSGSVSGSAGGGGKRKKTTDAAGLGVIADVPSSKSSLLVVGGRLVLWDVAFGVAVADAELPEGYSGPVTTLSLSPDSSRLTLGGGSQLFVCLASFQQRSLAVLMGKSHGTARFTAAGEARAPPLAAVEDLAAPGPREAAARAVLALVEEGRVTEAVDAALAPEMGRPSALLAASIASACVQGEHWDELAKLLATGCVSELACPGLVQRVLDAQQLPVLELVLSHLLDVREKHLIRVLRFISGGVSAEALADYGRTLASSSGAPGSKRKRKKSVGGGGAAGAQDPVAVAATRFFDLIVSAPRSTGFLVHELRALTFGETEMLLRYLRTKLLTTAAADQAQDAPSPSPTLIQLVDWTSMVLDAQFSPIVLKGSRQLQELIAETLATVKALSRDCEGAGGLKGLLCGFTDKRSAMPVEPIAQYSVESVKFG